MVMPLVLILASSSLQQVGPGSSIWRGVAQVSTYFWISNNTYGSITVLVLLEFTIQNRNMIESRGLANTLCGVLNHVVRVTW